MPTSPSARRGTERLKGRAPERPPRGPRLAAPLIAIGLLCIIALTVALLPASLVRRFLPPDIAAEDLSGTLWHGSAGRILLRAQDVGALEWHLHPAALLRLSAAADLHWVKAGFVADASAQIDRRGAMLRDVQGGGPLDDLAALGLLQGWHGTATFAFRELRLEFPMTVTGAVGALHVLNLSSQQIAAAADLGGYVLHVDQPRLAHDANLAATLSDTGGPLALQANVEFTAATHTGVLSGTIAERADAAPALRAELAPLAQLHARDPQGRIPVDLEFTL